MAVPGTSKFACACVRECACALPLSGAPPVSAYGTASSTPSASRAHSKSTVGFINTRYAILKQDTTSNCRDAAVPWRMINPCKSRRMNKSFVISTECSRPLRRLTSALALSSGSDARPRNPVATIQDAANDASSDTGKLRANTSR